MSSRALAAVYPPENIPVLVWVVRCQLDAACLLARAAPVWTSSPPRPVLLDLFRGPRDWTTAAVALALGELAARDADALPEVRRELIALAEGAFASSYCCYGWALTAVARSVLPRLPTTTSLGVLYNRADAPAVTRRRLLLPGARRLRLRDHRADPGRCARDRPRARDRCV